MEKLREFISSNRKTITAGIAGAGATLSTSANAALEQADVDAIVAVVTSDAAIAIGAGFAIMAVVLGGRVGMGLVKTFIASGAS
ncbi:hypothetical protein [Vibrio mimicus]|uniref:hypothetical protein n=1 Tax=Vibrio mimicus TaxID=674 RepID=UPI0004E3E6E1|nr:hypothetical protein [Vibrio mimicus]KFE30637.1 hypothetical protein DN31_2708 [Vibrio mimicus]